MTTSSFHRSFVPADTLDLVLSAGLAWGVIPTATAAAFVHAAPVDTLGNRLRAANLTAIRTYAPHQGLPTQRYVHVPIAQVDLDPTQVIKACQGLTRECACPGFAGSEEARLVDRIQAAATTRLPGYTDAAWLWTRPPITSEPAIGADAGGWRPPDLPVQWMDVPDLVTGWPTASAVILTAAAARALPGTVVDRPRIFLITHARELDDLTVWEALKGLNPTLVIWPVAEQWLRDTLTTTAVGGSQ